MYPNNEIVKQAIEWAHYSTHKFRVGAVLYRGNHIISGGYNDHLKTHPQSPHPFSTKHAEFSAVLLASKYIWNFSEFSVSSKCGIYVHRLKADGSPGMAKPCPWCQGMLDQLGITKIYWSLDFSNEVGPASNGSKGVGQWT